MRRGLDKTLAREVAVQLMDHDALGAHARDELGITDMATARPVQAALASAATFAAGAALPLAVAWLAPPSVRIWSISIASRAFQAALGALAARTGGASVLTSAWRVTFWGALALAITAGIGRLFGVSV